MTDDACRMVLRAFRQGYDTCELARLFDMPEHHICTALYWGRILERTDHEPENTVERLPSEGR